MSTVCGCTQVNQRISKTAHIKELNQEIDRLKAQVFRGKMPTLRMWAARR